jgi:hypothetical protein
VGTQLGLGGQVIDAAGSGELAHGGLVQSQLAADRRLGQPPGLQLLDRVLVGAHPGVHSPSGAGVGSRFVIIRAGQAPSRAPSAAGSAANS